MISRLRIHYVVEAGDSGFAVAGREAIRTLVAAGVEVTWEPMAWRDGRMQSYHGPLPPDPLLDPRRQAPSRPDAVVLHMMPSLLEHWLERYGEHRLIVHTVWESDRLPAGWGTLLNRVHAVIVPCRWNAQVFRNSGVDVPIHIIPHTLSEDISLERPEPTGRKTVFYSIGLWTSRKAIGQLVRAYLSAFDRADETELVLKTSAKDLSRLSRQFAVRHLLNAWNTSARSLTRLRREYDSRAPIRLLTGHDPRAQIVNLHMHSHCYTSLCHAEGWGLGAFEAAALGNPVVMTGFGGQTEFLDPDLSHLVDYTMVPCAANFFEGFFTPEQSWAEADHQSAVNALRDVHENRAAAFAKARVLQARIREHYSAERLAPQWRDVLEACCHG